MFPITAQTPEYLVVVVLEGTYRLEEHFETIREAYLDPILNYLKSPIIVEKEDAEKKDRMAPLLNLGLVIFGGYGRCSRRVTTSHYFKSRLNEFEELIKAIDFEGGKVYENPVAEGLVAALEMFDVYERNNKRSNIQKKHCILISNSLPCIDPVHHNLHDKYDMFTMDNIIDEMKKVKVYTAKDVVAPSHVVKLAGFKVSFTKQKEANIGVKRKPDELSAEKNNDNANSNENIDPATHMDIDATNANNNINDYTTGEKANQENNSPLPHGAKRLRLGSNDNDNDNNNAINGNGNSSNNNQTNDLIQSSSSTPLIDANQSQNDMEMNINTTLPIQQSSPSKLSNSPVIIQLSSPNPQRQNSQTLSVEPNNTNQQLRIQKFQQLQIQQQNRMNNPNAQKSAQNLNTQSSGAAQQTVAQQAAMYKNLHNQQNLANLINNKNITPERQQTNTKYCIPFEHPYSFAKSTAANTSATNSGNGTNNNGGMNRQGFTMTNVNSQNPQPGTPIINNINNNNVISTTTVTNPTVINNNNNLNLMNAATSVNNSTTNQMAAQMMTASTNATIATASPRLPTNAAANVNIISHNAIATGSTTSPSNLNAFSPNPNVNINTQNVIPMPQKLISISIWNGNIVWKQNELNCHVNVIPYQLGKHMPTDFMTQYWPEKMEISGAIPIKDIKDAGTSSLVVSLLPTPNQEDSKFKGMVDFLEKNKYALTIRFPKAPNPNGGIAIFVGLKRILVGMLFLNTPLPFISNPTSIAAATTAITSTKLKSSKYTTATHD
ncbi:14278_t:CDS:10 [Entrophospora sp. SA101]|nr:14278_t:CDS:10 [Entrophospora sp. SA101]